MLEQFTGCGRPKIAAISTVGDLRNELSRSFSHARRGDPASWRMFFYSSFFFPLVSFLFTFSCLFIFLMASEFRHCTIIWYYIALIFHDWHSAGRLPMHRLLIFMKSLIKHIKLCNPLSRGGELSYAVKPMEDFLSLLSIGNTWGPNNPCPRPHIQCTSRFGGSLGYRAWQWLLSVH